MKHFIIIRFNLENERSKETKINVDYDWVDNRLNKFFKYTYPSIVNQTNQNFTAYILLHNDTPIELSNKLKDKIKGDNNIVILNVNDKREARLILKTHIVDEDEFIVQTRFDNDDLYNIELIDTIQSNVELGHLNCLAFNNMAYYDDNGNFYLYDNLQFTSNVTTVVEDAKIKVLHTVGTGHGNYGKQDQFNVKYITDKTPYALVIHEDNDKKTISTFEKRRDTNLIKVISDSNILKKFIIDDEE